MGLLGNSQRRQLGGALGAKANLSQYKLADNAARANQMQNAAANTYTNLTKSQKKETTQAGLSPLAQGTLALKAGSLGVQGYQAYNMAGQDDQLMAAIQQKYGEGTTVEGNNIFNKDGQIVGTKTNFANNAGVQPTLGTTPTPNPVDPNSANGVINDVNAPQPDMAAAGTASTGAEVADTTSTGADTLSSTTEIGTGVSDAIETSELTLDALEGVEQATEFAQATELFTALG